MRAWPLLGVLLVASGAGCATTATSQTSTRPERPLVPTEIAPETSSAPTETIGGKGKALDPTTKISVTAASPSIVRTAPAPRIRPAPPPRR